MSRVKFEDVCSTDDYKVPGFVYRYSLGFSSPPLYMRYVVFGNGSISMYYDNFSYYLTLVIKSDGVSDLTGFENKGVNSSPFLP